MQHSISELRANRQWSTAIGYYAVRASVLKKFSQVLRSKGKPIGQQSLFWRLSTDLHSVNSMI